MIRKSPAWEITNDLLRDLPIVCTEFNIESAGLADHSYQIYSAIVYILYPERLSLSSIAILQQSLVPELGHSVHCY